MFEELPVQHQEMLGIDFMVNADKKWSIDLIFPQD
jgi:hypothetical protein